MNEIDAQCPFGSDERINAFFGSGELLNLLFVLTTKSFVFFRFGAPQTASKLWTRRYRFNWKWNMVLIEQLCGRRCTKEKERERKEKGAWTLHLYMLYLCRLSSTQLKYSTYTCEGVRTQFDGVLCKCCIDNAQRSISSSSSVVVFMVCPISSHAILSVQCSHILTEHRYTFGFNSIKSQFHDNEISHTRIALNETNGSKSHSLTHPHTRHGTTHDEVIWVIGLHIDERYDVDNDQ